MSLSPKEMENVIVKNLPEKTGKSLDEWLKVLLEESLSDTKEMKACLKEKHKVGHFQAQTIVKFFVEQKNRSL